jgi:type IV pilus assembly protein PilO
MNKWPWYGHVILAVVISAVAFFVYFKPKDQELKSLRTERETLEREVRDLKVKKLQLDQIETELTGMKATLKQLEVIIPEKKEIADILRKIQQLAFDARLEIIKFAPRGETKKEFYAEWPIPIEVTGNYHNLATFFDQLSNFARIFNVEDFSIRSLPSQTDATTISSSFTAKTYYFLDEPSAPPGAQPKPGGRP